MVCEKDVKNSNNAEKLPEEPGKLKASDLYSKIIETNEKLIKSNIEINNKVDKLQSILDNQEKKIKAKDEKLINLIISELYSNNSGEKGKNNLFNNIFKKFKSIMEWNYRHI